MTHRWKSAKNADSHTMLGKASHKTATLSHISHSPGDDGYPFGSSFWRQQCPTVCTNRGEKLSSPWGAPHPPPQQRRGGAKRRGGVGQESISRPPRLR